MKETPILMSTPMVKAILEGRKTQTRRVIKPQPDGKLTEYSFLGRHLWSDENLNLDEEPYGDYTPCPYGQVGDLLYCRETFRINAIGGVSYKADEGASWIGEWKPSIHMFKRDARIWLEITGVRVERVQKITLDDVIKEGVLPSIFDISDYKVGDTSQIGDISLFSVFKHLWDSLNGKRGYGWDFNPFVWCISFKRIDV